MEFQDFRSCALTLPGHRLSLSYADGAAVSKAEEPPRNPVRCPNRKSRLVLMVQSPYAEFVVNRDERLSLDGACVRARVSAAFAFFFFFSSAARNALPSNEDSRTDQSWEMTATQGYGVHSILFPLNVDR